MSPHAEPNPMEEALRQLARERWVDSEPSVIAFNAALAPVLRAALREALEAVVISGAGYALVRPNYASIAEAAFLRRLGEGKP